MQLLERMVLSNATRIFPRVASNVTLKYYLKLVANVSPSELKAEFLTYAKFNQIIFLSRGMGNICGDGDISEEESTPEHEPYRKNQPERREHHERYPGVHYVEENRLRDNAYRGKELDDSEPKCSCYGPTPDERFFVQRCPHPQVLNTTISKDLAEITEESKAKAQELRQERIHLIKLKVKEITGKDVDFDAGMSISILIKYIL